MSDPELERLLKERMDRMTSDAVHAGSIIHLTTSNFDSKIGSGNPVLVDFWAVWCGPCRVMDPVLEKLAERYAGKVTFGKLNVDEEPEIATRFDVFSIPTFMIFKHGRPEDVVIGAVGSAALERAVQKAIGS